MDETNNINQLFEEGKKEMQSADTSIKNPISAMKSEWDRGQVLPQTAARFIAGGATAYQAYKYLKNLKEIKSAIAKEEEIMNRLANPAARNAKTGQGVGTQPFEKEGFRISQGGKYTEPATTKGGTGTTKIRPPLVRPVGGTGEGLVKLAEEMPPWRQSLYITAQDIASWMKQPNNFKQRATTPMFEIKGIKTIPTMEGERISAGVPYRQTYVVTPADIAKGELPAKGLSAADLPADPARRTARLLRGLASGAKTVGGYLGNALSKIGRASNAVAPISIIADELKRQNADYQNPVTGEVFNRDEVIDLGGGVYTADSVNDMLRMHPMNAKNHPEITDSMRYAYYPAWFTEDPAITRRKMDEKFYNETGAGRPVPMTTPSK